MNNKQQSLVLSIIDFLNESINDGTVKADDKESLEVAVQCIGEAFGVDPADDDQRQKLSVKPATLQSIFDVYLKTKDKAAGSSAGAGTSAAPHVPSAEAKAQAEKLKQTGNTQMSSKQYDQAIESYTKAIELDGTNPVYYSNRAAAYTSKGDFLSSIGDANQAIALDSKFVKAYHRLGHAQYSLGDFKAAVVAFEKGQELDPNNKSFIDGIRNAKARIVPDDDDDDDVPPPLEGTPAAARSGGAGAGAGGMADMLSAMGGGGGAGGLPDMASIMNNPAMMAAAQQMMSNGGLENLMRNPTVANMMGRLQSGGGMPSMAELMSDPSIRDLASQFGGMGGAPGAGGR